MKNQNQIKRMSFLDGMVYASNKALNQFFGHDGPVYGIALIFIQDRKQGNPWTDEEKQYADYISQSALRDLRNKYLTKLICDGIIPDCAMSRRFMVTGSGFTHKGYAF